MNVTRIPLKNFRRSHEVAPARLEEVDRMLIDAGFELGGNGPLGAKLALRRDLLIEYLHAINDASKQLWKPHLAALAKRMRLSVAEVYEVASFYHHFRIVGDINDTAAPTPPRVIVRVCNGLACEMRGAKKLCPSTIYHRRS